MGQKTRYEPRKPEVVLIFGKTKMGGRLIAGDQSYVHISRFVWVGSMNQQIEC